MAHKAMGCHLFQTHRKPHWNVHVFSLANTKNCSDKIIMIHKEKEI